MGNAATSLEMDEPGSAELPRLLSVMLRPVVASVSSAVEAVDDDADAAVAYLFLARAAITEALNTVEALRH